MQEAVGKTWLLSFTLCSEKAGLLSSLYMPAGLQSWCKVSTEALPLFHCAEGGNELNWLRTQLSTLLWYCWLLMH